MKNQSSFLKPALAVFALVAGIAATAQAQSITWSAPETISGTQDVVTAGTQFSSWAPFDSNIGNYAPFNGVPFQYAAFPGASDNFGAGDSFFGQATTPDTKYDTALEAGQYGADVANGSTIENYISWNGMTVGHEYEVQFWVEDERNLGVTRSETLSGGVTSGATPVGSDTSAPLYFPADGTGNGEFITGTFVADSANGSIGFTPYSSVDGTAASQFNLAQIRDLGVAVPEPTTMALGGLAGLALLFRKRKQA
jgi:hypothetical protein